MIAAPIQRDVDGVPKGLHLARVPSKGYTGFACASWFTEPTWRVRFNGLWDRDGVPGLCAVR
jgi:hypothetical protein